MREESEILLQAELLRCQLAAVLQGTPAAAHKDPVVLSLLDRIETLLWVLEESSAGQTLH